MPHWQKIVKNKIAEIKDHPDFNDDWETICRTRSHDALFRLNLDRFVRKYNAPLVAIPFLRRIILFGEVDFENVTPPILIVSEVDGLVLPSDDPGNEAEAYRMFRSAYKHGRVLLDLTANVERKDIDDFLDRYFNDLIKPRLKLLDNNRPNAHHTRQQLTRFNRIAGLYKEKREAGQKRNIYREIEIETEYSPSEVKKEVALYLQQKKFSPLALNEYRKIMGQHNR